MCGSSLSSFICRVRNYSVKCQLPDTSTWSFYCRENFESNILYHNKAQLISRLYLSQFFHRPRKRSTWQSTDLTEASPSWSWFDKWKLESYRSIWLFILYKITWSNIAIKSLDKTYFNVLNQPTSVQRVKVLTRTSQSCIKIQSVLN